MIKETTDLAIINSFLLNFNTSITEIGVYDRYLIYEIDNENIAFLNYTLIYDRSEINYIFVDEKFRKTDKASELLQFLINVLRIESVKNITLEVKKTNEIAIKFYKKHGFIESAIREKYYDGVDAILMLRELG